ncbi:MAG TPA: hypothetical protein VL100_12500, partial [Croceibacterium sp.]|nr:hypothetical protein [Croceibacterium sp.]
MTKYVGLIAAGLLVSTGTIGPALAQSSVVGGVSAGVVTPDTNYNRQTYSQFRDQVDNHHVHDAASPAGIHANAGKIAECITRRSGDKASDLLGGGLTGDADYQRLGKALNGKLRSCTSGDASATASAISGVLAEQLLALKAPTFSDRAIGVSENDAQAFYGDLGGRVTFDNIAGCLAVYSPGLTYKLVQTEAGSDAETAALNALFAQTPECKMSTPPTSMVPAPTQR